MKIIHYFLTGFIFLLKSPFYCTKYFLIGFTTIITIIPKYILIGIKYLFGKKQQEKEDVLENKFIPITIITLSLATYLISVFILTRWFVQNERTKKFADSLNNSSMIITQENITEDTPDQYQDITSSILQEDTNSFNSNDNSYININYIDVNLNYYTSKNPETVGWIQVNGTNINYPIVQHTDNSFYLEHDFYQRKTNIGWIFADYRDNFETFNNNTIIYGHNLINRTMFGSIPYMLNKNWFQKANNHYIKLSTKTTNSIWQIFSVYKIEPTTDYLQSGFNSTTLYQEFLDKIKNRSSYNFDLPINYTDKIITLSTCDDTGTKRIAVHAKLINIESKTN